MRPSRLLATLVGLAFSLAAGVASAQKTQLLVYTALETDQLKAYQEAFNKVHPDIEIKWVRDSTGVITAKLLAEKANPQADVVMGVAASSLALLDKTERELQVAYALAAMRALQPELLGQGAGMINFFRQFGRRLDTTHGEPLASQLFDELVALANRRGLFTTELIQRAALLLHAVVRPEHPL